MVYLFYDLNMNLVENSSGVLQVQDPNDLGLLKEEHLMAEQAGFFYTYLMNSSGSEVNFDVYKITYIRPKVRAINHYYPYGLQMYGLDQLDKDYTYKYGGKELQNGDILDNSSTGLELYDIEARYYDPATGLWHVPDPAEQFHNPYLAMGNNPVVYVDENGEFVGIVVTLATVVITATSTAATIAAIAVPTITLGLVATAAVASGTFATAASTATAAIPPDGYLWDPAKPNQLQWQNTQGRSEGLDYITNTQTGETITRPMHTNFAEINPTGDLPGRFSLNTKMRVNFPKISSLPASPLSPYIAAPSLQAGVSTATFGPLAASGGFNPLGLLGAGAGGWAAAGAHSYYNPKSLRWWSTSQQRYYNGNNFTGNKWTNNGMRGARNSYRAFRGFGYALGAYNMYNINALHNAHQINDLQMILEQGSNAYSTFGGLPGAAWGIGWELGRAITTIPGYHEYFRVPMQRLLHLRP